MCWMCANPETVHFAADAGVVSGNYGDAAAAGLSRIITKTGNQLIDGVLSGTAWKFTNFSFAYPQSAASYGLNYGQGEQTSFQPFNQVQTLAADWARSLVADYTLATFVQGNPGNANLRYGNFQAGANQVTHGYYPDGFSSMGDIWYSQKNGDQFTAAIGGFAMATILHETGLALGLKHGHGLGINDAGGAAQNADSVTIPNFGALPTNYDNWNYSLMTYRSYTGAAMEPVQGNMASDNPTTFMMADIAALQHMYGANYAGASSTGTLYQWDSNGNFFENGSLFLPAAVNGKVFQTIWDGGGADTYDTSNFSTNQTIDLRPGQFSTFDSSKVADLDRGTAVIPALGNIANALLFNNDTRSLIENATTGSGNDSIIGNSAANVLKGGGGNDTLEGGAGNDTIDGGAGSDAISFAGASTGMTLVMGDSGPGTGHVYAGDPIGLDTFVNIENVVCGDSGDAVSGDNQANSLDGRGGNDNIYGGGGDDFLSGGSGADAIDGGAGSDTLSYYGATTGMTLVMGSTGPNSGQVFAGEPIGMDTFSNIENVLCGNQADTVGCDGNGNFVAGFGGDDTIFGWTGNDTLWGGDGNDQLFGQQDNDIINGDAGNDKLFGWAGNDTLTGGSGADSFMWTGAGEGLDVVKDYSYAQGDLIDVVGNPASFIYYQAGSSVLIIDPGTGQAIFNITNYNLSNGLAIV